MSHEHDDTIERALRAHADLGLRPQADASIVDAVARQLAGASPAAPARRVRTIVLAAAATLAAAGATAAATGLWTPSLGDEQRGHPTVASSDVPAVQLQRFGVLRRAADATDRDALTQHALRYLDARFDGVRTQRIRAVHDTPDGKRYLIVPVERSDSGISDALCLYAVDVEGGGVSCWSTQQILDGEASLVALPAPADGKPRDGGDLESLRPTTTGAMTVGLVPDGVAMVVASDGARADVHDNVYVLHTLATGPAAVVWRDSHREVIPQG